MTFPKSEAIIIRELAQAITIRVRDFWNERGIDTTKATTEPSTMAALQVLYAGIASTMEDPEEWIERATSYFKSKETREFMSELRQYYIREKSE